MSTLIHTLLLPFSGFYESIHSHIIYDAVSTMLDDQDDEGTIDCATQKFLSYEAMQSVYTTYASAYASSFLEHCDLPSEYKDAIQFQSLDSPKEYNFTTDRIFCTVSPAFLEYMYMTVRVNDLDSYARGAYTNRDGFISFYHSDFREWGQLNTWDHNQISTLFECWVMTCSNIPLDTDNTINEWEIAMDRQYTLYCDIQEANNLYPNLDNNL